MPLSFPHSRRPFRTSPCELVIAFTPGSSTDIIGRAVAAKAPEMWGQPVVAENRVGAGGSIGSKVVVDSAPDGYTLLANSSAHVANPGIYAKLPYDTLKDFTNLALLGGGPNVLISGRRPAGRRSSDSSPPPRRIPASSISPRPASAAARTSTWRS